MSARQRSRSAPCAYLGHDWQSTTSDQYRRCHRCHLTMRWDRHLDAWIQVSERQPTQRSQQSTEQGPYEQRSWLEEAAAAPAATPERKDNIA